MTQTVKLLRIYTDEGAYLGDRRVLEVIASRAREAGMAGLPFWMRAWALAARPMCIVVTYSKATELLSSRSSMRKSGYGRLSVILAIFRMSG